MFTISGGNTKAKRPQPRAPAMLRKSVKSGTIIAMPVIKIITTERKITLFAFRYFPRLKNGSCSAMSNAHRI